MQLTMCDDLHVRAGSGNWRRARMQGIGASEIGMALGIAPHTFAFFANAVDLVDEVANPFRPRRFPFSHSQRMK